MTLVRVLLAIYIASALPFAAEAQSVDMKALAQVPAEKLAQTAETVSFERSASLHCRWMSEDDAGVLGSVWVELYRQAGLASDAAASRVEAAKETGEARGKALACDGPEAVAVKAEALNQLEHWNDVYLSRAEGMISVEMVKGTALSSLSEHRSFLYALNNKLRDKNAANPTLLRAQESERVFGQGALEFIFAGTGDPKRNSAELLYATAVVDSTNNVAKSIAMRSEQQAIAKETVDLEKQRAAAAEYARAHPQPAPSAAPVTAASPSQTPSSAERERQAYYEAHKYDSLNEMNAEADRTAAKYFVQTHSYDYSMPSGFIAKAQLAGDELSLPALKHYGLEHNRIPSEKFETNRADWCLVGPKTCALALELEHSLGVRNLDALGSKWANEARWRQHQAAIEAATAAATTVVVRTYRSDGSYSDRTMTPEQVHSCANYGSCP